MTEYEDSEFWEYIITDDEGTMIGIRNDAPKRVMKDYREFLEEQVYAEKHNMKI